MTKYEKQLEERVEELEKELEAASVSADDYEIVKAYLKGFIKNKANKHGFYDGPAFLRDMIEKLEDEEIKEMWNDYTKDQEAAWANKERLFKKAFSRNGKSSWGKKR